MATTWLVFMVIMVILLSSLSRQQENEAQECRVYKVIGNTTRYQTPPMAIDNLLTVSFYISAEGDTTRDAHIILKGNSSVGNVHINREGEILFSVMKGPPKNASLAFRPAISNYSWVTLAVLLQDSNIVIYRTEDRENALVSQASLGSKVTATVSASDIQYVVFNCPAGCLMHDSTSPLIGRQLSIPVDGIALYIKQEEEAQNAFLQLGFTDVKGNLTTLKIDVTKHGASLWHKLTIVHNKEDHVNVTVFVDGKGKEVGKAYMMEDLLTVTILNSSSVLWSLHCYPENPTGQGGWNIDISRNASIAPEGKKAGAGIGEVLAWVLAAIALFIVMIMALLLCTKMGPREDTLGYGASVGVVTSFGKMVMQNEADREAEEDTEPDSPTLMMAPVVNINHRTPEEVDEDQVNSKEL